MGQDYISPGLKELVGYYSNRLSYQEVAELTRRTSGRGLLSDQKIEQMVIAQAQAISQQQRREALEVLSRGQPLPAINPLVDLYAPETKEVVLLADGIGVKEQAEKRYKTPRPQSEAKAGHTFAQSRVVMVAKQDGQYEYLADLLPAAEAAGEEIGLAQLVQSSLIREYGGHDSPLPIVAITDGATNLRLLLLTIFGRLVTIILDWYHLTKKVRELMSMIARTKQEKEAHLQFILSRLWYGLTDEVLAYLRGQLQAKNAAKLLELITYLEKHQTEIIDYHRRQQLGKPIGSGRVEKGCDLVIGRRQKKKGMSWSLPGSRSLALLRISELNGRWQQLWFSNPLPA